MALPDQGVALTRWVYRRGRRLVLDPPGGRLAMAAPRTARFLVGTWQRGRSVPVYPDPPAARPTPGLALQVAMDEVILAVMKSPKRYPHRPDYDRVGGEVAAGVALFEESGWLDGPRRFHRDPDPPDDLEFVAPGRAIRLRYEHATFSSGYEPWPDEPGRDRWMAFAANRTVHAWVLRHPGNEPRPWVVCLHGFGTGRAGMDLPSFRAGSLHRGLGLNVVVPVLPLHGARSPGGMSGADMMSFDMMNSVHGLAQATWDVRRVIAWTREQGATSVGLYGVSLGGYVAALTASVEPDLDVVVTAVPAVDLPALFAHHCPPRLRARAIEHDLLGERTHRLHRVVSPLAMRPLVPRDRRFIVAGLGDRMSTPKQAYRLWQHWEQPEMAWFAGNHVGYFWSREADRFVRNALGLLAA